ncbi:hypothetical protein [Nannocystis pusilla]|uniref:hypothetical protein n=1 Tax=Nannocystis pusilla TaxID=889268 RepID=UPI003B800E30
MWAQAGSRPWGQCRELERTAEIAVAKQSVSADGPNVWAERARLCPGRLRSWWRPRCSS